MKKYVFETYYLDDIVKQKYLFWKRKNVTIRGVREIGQTNSGGARYGKGLYTAFLSNQKMARSYGTVYFVLNAIPKNPVVKDYADLGDVFIQELKINYCKKNNLEVHFSDCFKFFEQNTTIEKEMLILGYDGLIIKGREMVNYKPNNDEILYFENEDQLKRYYVNNVLNK